MASFSVPVADSSSFSLTLGQLKSRIKRSVARDNQREFDAFWNNTDILTQAMDQALEWCRPVGVRVELEAVAGTAGLSTEGVVDTDTWRVLARLTKIESVQIKADFQGFDVWQDVPIKAVQQSSGTDGTAVLKFLYPIGIGSVVQVTGLWQFPLPTDDTHLVLWSYADLLVAASVAELYRLALHHGQKTDQMDFSAAETSWRMHATTLKMDIMGTLGFTPPTEEPTTPSPNRTKRRK